MRSPLPTLKEILLLIGVLVIVGLVGILVLDEEESDILLDLVVGTSVVVLIVGIAVFVYRRWSTQHRASLEAQRKTSKSGPGPPGPVYSSRWVTDPKLYTAVVFFQIVLGLILVVIVDVALHEVGRTVGAFSGLVFVLMNGWAIYAFIRYRQGRQEESAQILAATVNSDLSLAPTLRSYLRDRPKRSTGRIILSGLVCFVLPFYTYVRLCIGWLRFDELVKRLVVRLESGEALSSALRSVPGVADRETRLAVSVGEATGTLAARLHDAQRERWTAAWFEIAPRFLYPLVVFLFVSGITTFLMISIIPKYKKIFDEFGAKLPPVTMSLVEVTLWINEYVAVISIIKFMALTGLATLIANPTVRWKTPIIGPLYRSSIRATVLRTLGRMLEAGQTVPQALEFLSESDDLPAVVQHRLDRAWIMVNQGETLDIALERSGLLPRSMSPLVSAAQRARTLPWALKELGDHLAGRAFHIAKRLSLIVSPMLIIAIVAMVAFIVLGIFMPLIELLTRLGE